MIKKFLSIFLLVISFSAIAQDARTYIPPNAYPLIPIYQKEIEAFFSTFPLPWYFPALTEHESCISLKHKRCMSPTSRLKTAREEGAGLPQITRTYNADGSIRFDTLADLKRAYKQELKDLTWDNVYERADLQIRSMVLLSSQNWRRFIDVKDATQHTAMMDASYNAGAGRVNKMRIACGLQKDCDPDIWFGNVETMNLTGNKALAPGYAGRSAYTIMTYHVDDVLNVRLHKYEVLMTKK